MKICTFEVNWIHFDAATGDIHASWNNPPRKWHLQQEDPVHISNMGYSTLTLSKFDGFDNIWKEHTSDGQLRGCLSCNCFFNYSNTYHPVNWKPFSSFRLCQTTGLLPCFKKMVRWAHKSLVNMRDYLLHDYLEITELMVADMAQQMTASRIYVEKKYIEKNQSKASALAEVSIYDFQFARNMLLRASKGLHWYRMFYVRVHHKKNKYFICQNSHYEKLNLETTA